MIVSTEAEPIGSARKMFIILKVSENTCITCFHGVFYVMQRWRAGVFFSCHNLLLVETAHLSNSSLLIIAREEYVIPSNVTSAFSHRS